ncbi:MAG TPA: secondary thiamine-phosphate synthase enzyme YjbQ [bacterium]|nr:secondary thiamine-phosphate synthase enzyme YjbQ [bacterium]
MLYEINVKTNSSVELIDITRKINETISKSGIDSGICLVFTPHTTAAITINENADSDVQSDIIKEINKIIPFNDNYRHSEGNSAAHLKSSLFGASENIIVESGRLLLGTWQGIYFCEFDGPRSRKVFVKILKG